MVIKMNTKRTGAAAQGRPVGGASWCGGTGRPPKGAALLLLHYFSAFIFCMLLLY